PSEEFIPFLYPPLWYWLAAALSRALPTFVACKLVTLAATALCTWGIARVAYLLGARRFWVIAAMLLHFAAYGITLTFYDLERVDVLEPALAMIGLVLLIQPGGQAELRGALGGAVVALSFFAKQPGLLAFVAVVAALFVARERKRAL